MGLSHVFGIPWHQRHHNLGSKSIRHMRKVQLWPCKQFLANLTWEFNVSFKSWWLSVWCWRPNQKACVLQPGVSQHAIWNESTLFSPKDYVVSPQKAKNRGFTTKTPPKWLLNLDSKEFHWKVHLTWKKYLKKNNNNQTRTSDTLNSVP